MTLYLLILILCITCCYAFEKSQISLDEFLQVRCSLHPNEQAFTTWYGTALAVIPQQASKHIFDVVGMNVARCIKAKDGKTVYLTSREVQLFVDKSTGEKLNTWFNPFTGENTTVVHVANNPVQQELTEGMFLPGIRDTSDSSTIYLDVPLFYPNPLAKNATLYPYSPYKNYQAGEFFKFFYSNQQLQQSSFSWTRHSIWYPWMKMKDLDGQLFFTAQGARVSSFEELPLILKKEIQTRIPVYQNAPNCMLDVPNETSWTYFAKVFDQFISGAEFPIPQFKDTRPCLSFGK